MSCRTPRQLQYLQGPIDTASLSKINFPEPVIQKGDILSIVVYSDNPELTTFYNQQTGSNTAAGSTNSPTTASSVSGYEVDDNGNIRFPSLGSVHVEGRSTRQLQDSLSHNLTQYLKNPYCSVRIINKKFTILGEVLKQGLYNFPAERINIFEALGLAGDITMYGLRDSIMVIREANGKRTFGNLSVNDPNVLLSPYYYLHQNDIIIVKATPKKPTLSDQSTTRNLAIVATIATILTSLAVVFNIFRR
ncbi:MAG: polysaccharide biosynthesis/export family protein [Bacteroidetes bacterium]|nr:polysaccharide biosynthesis/export family protein [Bacteroidota bacterium]